MNNTPRIFNPADAPYSEEAEEATIGAILINPDVLLDIQGTLQGDDFYFLRHQYIYAAMLDLVKRDQPVDYLTLSIRLQEKHQLDEIGGLPYLTRLVNNTPTSIYGTFYADIVFRASLRRRLLLLADEVKATALDETQDIETVLEQTIGRVLAFVEHSDGDNPTRSFKDAAAAHVAKVQAAFLNPGVFTGIPSSIPEINEFNFGGYWNGELVVFGGRPGMGKSSVLVTEAIHAARLGRKVVLFSLEMSMDDLVGIALAMEADLPSPRRMLAGLLTPSELQRYLEAVERLTRQLGDYLYLDDISTLTPLKLRSRCKILKARYGLDAIFVDYIQLLSGGKEGDYWNRQQEIGYITRSLKRLAKDLDCPVITAAQINRESEKTGDGRPKLHHLRESGDIEADANIVFGVWRDMEATGAVVAMELIPLKARDADITRIIRVLYERAKKWVKPRAQSHQEQAYVQQNDEPPIPEGDIEF